jgi:hypothetical protein
MADATDMADMADRSAVSAIVGSIETTPDRNSRSRNADRLGLKN